MNKATYDLLIAIFRFTKDFSHEVLQEARERIEVIRLFIRLMKDMQQISIKQFVLINESVENVSKQLTGWQKAMS